MVWGTFQQLRRAQFLNILSSFFDQDLRAILNPNHNYVSIVKVMSDERFGIKGNQSRLNGGKLSLFGWMMRREDKQREAHNQHYYCPYQKLSMFIGGQSAGRRKGKGWWERANTLFCTRKHARACVRESQTGNRKGKWNFISIEREFQVLFP